MSRHRAIAVLCALALLAAVVVVGLRLTKRASRPAGAAVPSGALLLQTRADTLAAIAQRIYYQEAFGSPNSSAYRALSALPGLVDGLEHGDVKLARHTLYQVTFGHVVRARVVRHTRTLVDVGLRFVVAGQLRPLHASDGAYLGRIEVSVQDLIGLIKLFHRLTGADIVVRGHVGHAKSSLAPLRRAPLPTTGRVAVAGRRYFVSSFRRVGFAGEPLTVWVLVEVK